MSDLSKSSKHLSNSEFILQRVVSGLLQNMAPLILTQKTLSHIPVNHLDMISVSFIVSQSRINLQICHVGVRGMFFLGVGGCEFRGFQFQDFGVGPNYIGYCQI